MMEENGVDLGSFAQRAEELAGQGKTPLYFADEKRVLGLIAVADTPKPTSAAAVAAFRQLGLEVVMLTGDNQRTADAIGKELGVTQVMAQVLEPKDDTWRGLGDIPNSGFGLKPEFAAFDAAARFGFSPAPQTAPSPCRCGDVICGRIGPKECPLFGSVCTPDNPVGPCMVSGEGACAAAYLYGRE